MARSSTPQGPGWFMFFQRTWETHKRKKKKGREEKELMEILMMVATMELIK